MTVLEFRRTRAGTPVRVLRMLRSMNRGMAPPTGLQWSVDPVAATLPSGHEPEGRERPTPLATRLYVVAVAAAATVVAAFVLPGAQWSRAVAATVAVKIAAILLLPPAAAGAALALGTLSILLREDMPRMRMLFVMCMVYLSANIGGAVYAALHGTRSMMQPEMPHVLFPVLVTSLVLSTMPSVFIAPIAVLGAQAWLRSVVNDAVRHAIPRNVAYSFVGLLAAVLWRHHAQVLATLVILGPLLVTRWAAAQYSQQRAAHDATVRALVQAVEIKDLYTRGHSERVAKASEMIARQLGMDEDRIGTLRYAAILHDVGKLGVPTRLLQKDGQFDAAELETIRVHPVRGVDVVRDIAFLNEAYTAILHHHERMDGRGYPTGLAGERIPRFARIIAVADAFDSMTSTRSYRAARSVPAAMTELQACAGSQFDPVMVDAMESALAEAARDGRPWLGDGTMPDPVDTTVEATDGEFARDAAFALDGAMVDTASASDDESYDHDDPAFVVPAPLSARQRGGSPARDVARRGRR
jgi:putative nucleotidyltransferase with HDIG domain